MRVFRCFLSGLMLLAALGSAAAAKPMHGIAMYGQPALPPDFVSLPYANPDAPKGGTVTFGQPGDFDTLNPFNVSGKPAAGVSTHVVETLMARSIDEPFSLYGLLAESVETDDSRGWVEFTLRPQAKFSDGSPVTVGDVIWSFETLGTLGSPRYQTAWKKVADIKQTGPRSLRITFTAPDRELPLLMGLRPVLKKADWQGRDFESSSLSPFIGSGPYVIDKVDPGKKIGYRLNPNYWGRDLPINRGRNNFERLTYDYYGDGNVIFQAFTAGATDFFRETNAGKWQSAYDFPDLTSGKVLREEIPNQRPSGLSGLVINSRNPLFSDWRVRQAMLLAFNYAFINQTLNGGIEKRITSYFSNSPLAGGTEPADGALSALLAPFAADLLPGTLEGYTLPQGNATNAIDRKSLREATKLLEAAGWSAEGGRLHNAQGQDFAFDILLPSGSGDPDSVVAIYVEALRPLGMQVTVTPVDGAQYAERISRYAFDMTWYNVAATPSPGNEQTLYWGSGGVTTPGTRNLMGMASPAAEQMIALLLATDDPDQARLAAQALDRIISAGRYVIPIWFPAVSRIAYRKGLHHPEYIPLYGDWPGFMPDVWWYKE